MGCYEAFTKGVIDFITNIAGTQNSSESPSSTRILYRHVAFCLSKKISGGWGWGAIPPESSQKVRDDIYKNPFFPLHFTTLLTVFLFNQILFTASHPILGVAKAISCPFFTVLAFAFFSPLPILESLNPLWLGFSHLESSIQFPAMGQANCFGLSSCCYLSP